MSFNPFIFTFVGQHLLDYRSNVVGIVQEMILSKENISIHMRLTDGTRHDFSGTHDAFSCSSDAILVSYGPSLRLVEVAEDGSYSRIDMPMNSRTEDIKYILASTFLGSKFIALRPMIEVVIKKITLKNNGVRFDFSSADGKTLPSDYKSIEVPFDCISPIGFSEGKGMFQGHSTYVRSSSKLG